jgi:hypothetical protein
LLNFQIRGKTATGSKAIIPQSQLDGFTLKDFEEEWRTARQRMLNLKFDS